MKTANLNNELKQLGMPELKERLETLQRELFSLRLNSSTSHVKDNSQFKKLRKGIARVMTYIGMRAL